MMVETAVMGGKPEVFQEKTDNFVDDNSKILTTILLTAIQQKLKLIEDFEDDY